MVNTGDILAEKERAARAAEPPQTDEKLDDIMLAMDVVDTLRHEKLLLEKDLNAEDRRQALIARLRDIYEAQGIDVPDSVLLDGVMALEEQRFTYEPPKKGFSRKLAMIYINRRKWLPLLYTLAFIFGSVFAINYVGFVRPQQVETKRVETLLNKTLPDALADNHAKAHSIADTDTLRARADELLALGSDAIARKDIKEAERISGELTRYADDLTQAYTIRIVSRPGEYSGVFRINSDGGQEVRNYYLIVEGIAADGNRVHVLISSEEDQATKRTPIWGVRVPQAVFNQVAADKQDDQIIQNAVIGEKKRGDLTPAYSIQTSGGLILDW